MSADQSHPAGGAEAEAISLVTVLNMLLRRRYLIVGIGTLLTVIVIGTLLLLPRNWTSTSSFMLQTRQALPGNLTGLAAQFGVALPTGEASQSPAFYAELLKSREILSTIIDTRYTLTVDGAPVEKSASEWLKVTGSNPALQRDKAIRKLGEKISVSQSLKTGIVTLDVKMRNADLARQINTQMLSWLNTFNLQKRQSQAAAERKFTEARLEEARQQLRASENDLLSFTQRNREVRNSPLLMLEQDRLSREVSTRQQVYTSVLQAYDRARFEEVRDTPVLTVLQDPEAPVRPDTRGIVAKTILTLILGLGLGFLVALSREFGMGSGEAGSEMDQLSRHRADLGNDLRHPLRTIGRVVRMSGPAS